MSEKNERDEARVILKKITDFNITNNYYQKDLKDEVARDFRKLLFVDNPTVRKFLEKLLISIKLVAQEFDLMGTEVEVDKSEEEKTSEEEGAEKEQSEEEEAKEKPTEENPDETPTEETPAEETAPPLPENLVLTLPENLVLKSYIKRASELLIDLLEE